MTTKELRARLVGMIEELKAGLDDETESRMVESLVNPEIVLSHAEALLFGRLDALVRVVAILDKDCGEK